MYVVKAAVEAAGGSVSGADWTADGNTNKAASAILYKDGVGTLFGQNAA